jgi:hypothetical protein
VGILHTLVVYRTLCIVTTGEQLTEKKIGLTPNLSMALATSLYRKTDQCGISISSFLLNNAVTHREESSDLVMKICPYDYGVMNAK